MKRRQQVEEIYRREVLKLRSDFIAQSLAQLRRLRAVLQQESAPRLSDDARGQSRAIVRRLLDSGQTYGLTRPVHRASQLSNDLEVIEETNGRLAEEQRQALCSHIDNLISALEQDEPPSS